MRIASDRHKFYKGVYDVINLALAGGVVQLNNRPVFINDNSLVGRRLTWPQAQAKAYRHRCLGWGGEILILRRHGT